MFTLIYHNYDFTLGVETVFAKGHIVNILGFMSYKVFVAMTQLCHYSVKLIVSKEIVCKEMGMAVFQQTLSLCFSTELYLQNRWWAGFSL